MHYEMTWRNKWLTADCTSFAEMIAALRAAANDLQEMADAGLVLDASGGPDDYMHITTEDAALAERFGLHKMEDEDEYCEGCEICGADEHSEYQSEDH